MNTLEVRKLINDKSNQLASELSVLNCDYGFECSISTTEKMIIISETIFSDVDNEMIDTGIEHSLSLKDAIIFLDKALIDAKNESNY